MSPTLTPQTCLHPAATVLSSLSMLLTGIDRPVVLPPPWWAFGSFPVVVVVNTAA